MLAMPEYLKEKRDQFIWSLSKQGYNGQQIATIFNISRSGVFKIISRMPKDWRSPWTKK